MSDIEFDHDAVASYPRPLHSVATSLASACTLPTPDAGVSTTLTRDTVAQIATQSQAVGTAFDDLCGAVLFCLKLYPETDSAIGFVFDAGAEQALR